MKLHQVYGRNTFFESALLRRFELRLDDSDAPTLRDRRGHRGDGTFHLHPENIDNRTNLWHPLYRWFGEWVHAHATN